jgi:hypothetical protein
MCRDSFQWYTVIMYIVTIKKNICVSVRFLFFFSFFFLLNILKSCKPVEIVGLRTIWKWPGESLRYRWRIGKTKPYEHALVDNRHGIRRRLAVSTNPLRETNHRILWFLKYIIIIGDNFSNHSWINGSLISYKRILY